MKLEVRGMLCEKSCAEKCLDYCCKNSSNLYWASITFTNSLNLAAECVNLNKCVPHNYRTFRTDICERPLYTSDFLNGNI